MRNRLKEVIEHSETFEFAARLAEGGFTERLYRVRQDTRKEQMKRNFSRTIK